LWIVTNADLLAELQRQTKLLRDILSEQQTIRRLLFLQTKPGPIKIRLIAERKRGNMDILQYEADLPVVPPGTDVESQELTITAGAETEVQALAVDVLLATFEVPQDSTVVLSLVWIDDGGNRSAAKTQDFVALDTISADAPGDFGEIRLVGERRTEDT